MAAQKSLLDILRLAAEHLDAAGIKSARLDAEVLLSHLLGIERIQLYVQFDRPLNRSEVEAFRSVISRRARREPVAYIVGEREFRSFMLRVNRHVLVPRPETELLVEEALQGLQSLRDERPCPRVADVGTGSGAVVIGLAREVAEAEFVATDLDEDALSVARENVRLHELENRIQIRQGDLLAPLLGERFDCVLSNPPYVGLQEWRTLEPDVREFEPRLALVGGDDGLDIIRRLIDEAPDVLVPGGFLALELGALQGEAVRQLARLRKYASCRIVQDLAGRDRVAVMEWGGERAED